MEIASICSGSSGNCILIKENDTNVLVDVGVSKKRVVDGLDFFNTSPNEIDAILITHEHSDHIQGLGVFLRAYPVSVYATRGTIDYILNSSSVGDVNPELFEVIEPGDEFKIGDLSVSAISTSHDANDSVCYRFDSGSKSFAVVTDLGTLSVFKKYNIPLHASTQMGIHNYQGAKLAKELGFSRVVLSREALKDDIKKIKTLGLEIEFFVHGALCVSFSGGCLLSSFMSGDSGNRGLCKQPCRLPYTSTLSGKDKYYLSPSDQCFIENLKLLEEWGVDSLKIEGRLKAPHYVGQVVREYRLALEGAKSPNYAELLRRAYNRGSFTKGYNFDATKDLMSINVQGNIGEYVGQVKKRANSSLYLELEKELNCTVT